MKILAIMGNPRGKGSGYKIVRKIEDRMRAAGDNLAEFADEEDNEDNKSAGSMLSADCQAEHGLREKGYRLRECSTRLCPG